jgi:hypothetical protein
MVAVVPVAAFIGLFLFKHTNYVRRLDIRVRIYNQIIEQLNHVYLREHGIEASYGKCGAWLEFSFDREDSEFFSFCSICWIFVLFFIVLVEMVQLRKTKSQLMIDNEPDVDMKAPVMPTVQREIEEGGYSKIDEEE